MKRRLALAAAVAAAIAAGPWRRTRGPRLAGCAVDRAREVVLERVPPRRHQRRPEVPSPRRVLRPRVRPPRAAALAVHPLRLPLRQARPPGQLSPDMRSLTACAPGTRAGSASAPGPARAPRTTTAAPCMDVQRDPHPQVHPLRPRTRVQLALGLQRRRDRVRRPRERADHAVALALLDRPHAVTGRNRPSRSRSCPPPRRPSPPGALPTTASTLRCHSAGT